MTTRPIHGTAISRKISTTFFVMGSRLMDPCGKMVVLRGMNKLIIFDTIDPLGDLSIPEIAKTGANCIRVGWGIKNLNLTPTSPADLDHIIQTCRDNGMIPIVGLWDYTDEPDGGFSRLPEYTAFWTSQEMVQLVKKHEGCLIVNIANEAATGDEDNNDDLQEFVRAYSFSVQQIRAAGINVPLVIDGMDQGKSLRCFSKIGAELTAADPLHNLLFSFHPYWPKRLTTGTTSILDAFHEAIDAEIPFIMGEISKFGAWADGASVCSAAGEVDYMQFIELANTYRIGWLAWEWGPGNGVMDENDQFRSCPNMDATSDRTFLSLTSVLPGDPNFWLRELIIEHPHGIAKTAKKTTWMINNSLSC
jgi:mannan endo-1,4-beta-mannosidase